MDFDSHPATRRKHSGGKSCEAARPDLGAAAVCLPRGGEYRSLFPPPKVFWAACGSHPDAAGAGGAGPFLRTARYVPCAGRPAGGAHRLSLIDKTDFWIFIALVFYCIRRLSLGR